MGRPSWAPEEIDIDRPSIARVYDCYLGGFHNFACDREVAERTIQVVPEAPLMARTNRAFLARAVRFCVANGIDQFLDIGSGIPTVGNVHEIAQRANPQARVAYVDIDPIAVVHSQAILDGNERAVSIRADVRQPKEILDDAGLRGLLDLERPVALLMLLVLHFLPDTDNPAGVVADFYDALAPGSYLVISHGSNDGQSGTRLEAGSSRYRSAVTASLQLRSREEILPLFHKFELVEPGLVPVADWRPDPSEKTDQPPFQFAYSGVGRKI